MYILNHISNYEYITFIFFLKYFTVVPLGYETHSVLPRQKGEVTTAHDFIAHLPILKTILGPFSKNYQLSPCMRKPTFIFEGTFYLLHLQRYYRSLPPWRAGLELEDLKGLFQQKLV